jgi:enamine deaminase RidA (YjgF/YER057c/UK114 family)
LDESGTTVGIGDVRAQAAQAVANLQVNLGDAGASLDDVIRTTVYVASSQRQDLVATWEVVRDAFAPMIRRILFWVWPPSAKYSSRRFLDHERPAAWRR